MKYTESQIKEFKKLGYNVNSNGQLIKETRLQKIIRVSDAETTMRSIEIKSSSYVERRIANSKRTDFVKSETRVENWWIDEERLAKGLVTTKKPGVDYSLLPDGTKVCRCCQNRYKKSDFYTSTSSKDCLRTICKSCNNKQSKSYLADKKNKK